MNTFSRSIYYIILPQTTNSRQVAQVKRVFSSFSQLTASFDFIYVCVKETHIWSGSFRESMKPELLFNGSSCCVLSGSSPHTCLCVSVIWPIPLLLLLIERRFHIGRADVQTGSRCCFVDVLTNEWVRTWERVWKHWPGEVEWFCTGSCGAAEGTCFTGEVLGFRVTQGIMFASGSPTSGLLTPACIMSRCICLSPFERSLMFPFTAVNVTWVPLSCFHRQRFIHQSFQEGSDSHFMFSHIY